MRVLVHEWVTGGGIAGPSLPATWSAEGRAMRLAIADDFHHVEGVDVVMTLDARFSEPGLPWATLAVAPGRDEEVLRRVAATVDYTVLIAPETDGVLEARAVLIGESGGRSLGSTPAAIALTTDKRQLADHLFERGIPTPGTRTFRTSEGLPRDHPFPAVMKPIDGAGSVHTFFVRGPGDGPSSTTLPDAMIIQPFCPGEPLSATFLLGPSGRPRLLGVGWQRIEIREGTIHYRGGRLPAPPEWARGAPTDAVRSVTGLRGVVGVDFVRDRATNRSTVIEINPRPTTSYVGLCRLHPPGAIARSWLATFDGSDAEDGLPDRVPSEKTRGLVFSPDGTTTEVRGVVDDDPG